MNADARACMLAHAAVLRHAGLRAEALDLCDRLIAAAPADTHPVQLSCEIHADGGENALALARIEAALSRGVVTGALLERAGALAHACGDVVRAVAFWQRGLSVDPALHEAAMRLAVVAIADGRPDDAARLLDRMCAVGSETADRTMSAAMLLRHFGHDAAAEPFVDVYTTLAPDTPERTHRLASLGRGPVPMRASADYVRHMFDGAAASYDINLLAIDNRGPRILASAMSKAGLAAGAGLRVLDAGCGTGLCAATVRPVADRLIGVDLSADMLAKAAERGQYDALEMLDIVDLGSAFPHCADLIVCMDVLPYFGDLDPVFTAFRKAQANGGYVITLIEDLSGAEACRFLPSGRYRHDRDRLIASARAAGFAPPTVEFCDTLRLEYGQDVVTRCVIFGP